MLKVFEAPPLIKISGDIAQVCLTRNKWAIIDANDVPLIAKHFWSYSKGKGTNGYAVTSVYKENGKQTSLYLHCLLLNDETRIVDHIDGNGLNNRRNNLRYVTAAQNSANRHTINQNSASHHRNIQKWTVRSNVYWVVHMQKGYGRSRLVKYFPFTSNGLDQAKNFADKIRENFFTYAT